MKNIHGLLGIRTQTLSFELPGSPEKWNKVFLFLEVKPIISIFHVTKCPQTENLKFANILKTLEKVRNGHNFS
jgi:hypothetical protein